MTLQSSGAISLNDIIAEFGLSAQAVFPRDFYGLGGAPASGALSLEDFYGRSHVVPVFTPSGGSVSSSSAYAASYTLSCSVAAIWTFSLPSGVTASIASGASATSVTFTSYTVGTHIIGVHGASGSTTADVSVQLTVSDGGPPV
ncbi:MAG: hypothetical protein JOY99_11050 [Sphingomonadaceae bacterium]|nr:hypothetical protein [Sphingomonadaceae bacterium]